MTNWMREYEGMIVSPQLRTILKTIPTLELPVGSAKPVVGPTLYLSFSLFLLPSSPFHGCGSQGHAFLSILHAPSIALCYLGNLTCSAQACLFLCDGSQHLST